MRRLTEILAFPNAWYRRRIVRRLFLGDISTKPTVNPTTETDAANASRAPSDTNQSKADFGKNVNKINPSDLRLDINGENQPKSSKLTSEKSSFDSSTSLSEGCQITAWETLVLFAFNFKRLQVQMNMGNVMGNVVSIY